MNILEQLRQTHSLNAAVKEAMDSLPSAVCYFTMDGSIKLCNPAMYRIYRMISGEDLQTLAELTGALNSCSRTTRIQRDGNVFLFPDGSAKQYSCRQIRTEENRIYLETVFTDVTELYGKRRELQQQSEELKKMYAELRSFSSQLLEITREQEILDMKARLHDQMNMGITAIRQILHQETASEDEASAIAAFRRAVRILQEENSYPQDDLNEFIQDAEVAGVHVSMTGTLPEEADLQQLMIAVLREACINAARHADASAMTAVLERNGDTSVLRITNDGRPPAKEVEPRGGLKDLKRKIEKAGGRMEIRSFPEFMLTVTLPAGAQDDRKEVQV